MSGRHPPLTTHRRLGRGAVLQRGFSAPYRAADVDSPARFEFLNVRFADPRYAEIVPVQRPQEALTVHAVDAAIRTLSKVRGSATGLPEDFDHDGGW